jgi:energy-coupling factor transport system permease protein
LGLFVAKNRVMNLFLYLDRDTPVHRLDPRTKLLLLLASFVAAVLFREPAPLAVLVVILLLYAAAGGALANLRRVWVLLATIAAVTVASWSVFFGGEQRIVWHVTWEGLRYGLAAALKIDGMIVSGLVFLSTTRTEEMVLGLIRWRVPFQAAFAFSLAVRMVPTIVGTAVTVSEAQRSRGLDLARGGPVRRLRSHVPLLVPIFLHTLRNTDQLAKALESRGFGARGVRTSLLAIGFHARDAAALALGASVLLGFLLVRIL